MVISIIFFVLIRTDIVWLRYVIRLLLVPDVYKRQITDEAIKTVIQNYTREAGVRQLEREISEICRKAARNIVQKEKKHLKVTSKNIEKYLGRKKYEADMANEKDDIGIVRGLAWTAVGGTTLQIEVNTMPGRCV